MSAHSYDPLYPITSDGVEVKTLSIRRPKVADLEMMDKSGGTVMQRSVALLVALTGLPPESVRNLDGEDFSALDEIVMGMLGKQTPSRT